MLIRPAVESDLKEVARVQIMSNKSTYKGIMPDSYLSALDVDVKHQEWINRFENSIGNESLYVIETNSRQIVGFYLLSERPTNDIADRELLSVYILSENQGQGIGRQIFRAIKDKYESDHVKSMMLWTLKDNPSRGFYERMGGELSGTRTIVRGSELQQVAYKWPCIDGLGG